MPVMPRSSHLDRRDQVAKEKKSQNEEMTDQQRFMRQQMEMQQRHAMMRAQAARQQVAPMTFEERKVQRSKDLLTEDELAEGVEIGTNSGKFFRYSFIGLAICLLVFLASLKVDSEVGIQLPEHAKRLSYTAQGLGGAESEKAAAAAKDAAKGVAPDLPDKDQALLDSYLESLNVKRPADTTRTGTTQKKKPAAATKSASDDESEAEEEEATPPAKSDGDDDDSVTASATADENENEEVSTVDKDDAFETPEQRIKRRRREDYEFKKALKVAHESKLADQQALTTCGKSCQDKYGAMQLHYDQINQQITNELWSVVSDNEDDAEAARENPTLVNPHKLRRTMEAKVKKLEEEQAQHKEGTEAHLDGALAIAEIKDSYAILANDESRRYYALYGRKPPPAMTKLSARDGGWGQSLLLRTHYHKLILTWLQFLESSKIDSFTIIFVFVCLFLGPALARLPQTVAMAQRMAEEWEEAAEMQKKMKQQ